VAFDEGSLANTAITDEEELELGNLSLHTQIEYP
jgi:hypothetical protein